MRFIQTLLLFLLPVLASIAQTVDKRASYCTSNQIHTMDVEHCTCEPRHSSCSTDCLACGIKITKATNFCNGGCTDQESNCMGCGIWFHTLCDCLQHPNTCTHSGTIKKDGPMIWVLLKRKHGHNLITTTDQLPGIVEMARNPQRYDDGWTFAQQNYNPTDQALALNSDRARTHEQFHIHVCARPTHGTYDKLSNEPLNTSGQLKQLKGDKELYCMSVSKAPITGFATAIHELLGKGHICEDIAGAGIMLDSRGNTWGCVTTNRDGPLAKFC